MKIIKLLLAIISMVSVSIGQNISISGTVKDDNGVGIQGATVKLENVDITTTTSNDGSFTLSQIVANNPGRLSPGTNLILSNGQLQITLQEPTEVRAIIYDIHGNIISRIQKTIDVGFHSLPLSGMGSGINFLKVNIGNFEHIIKSGISGQLVFASSMESPGTARGLQKYAEAVDSLDDVISVTKAGFLNYGVNAENSDTSGMEIIMVPSAGTVTDIDGNVYQTVRIGNQVWMAENLRTTRYRDGTPIQKVTEDAVWDDLGSSNKRTPLYCYYENDSAAYAEKFGALYNWYAVGAGNLAPSGWHEPSNDEFFDLRNYLIGNDYNWDGTTSGNKVGKSLATKTGWEVSPVEGATGNDPGQNNTTGFSAYPIGSRGHSGDFNGVNNYARFWTSEGNLNQGGHTVYHHIHYMTEPLVFRDYGPNLWGHSVRLVKD